jgi:hypothetical protein
MTVCALAPGGDSVEVSSDDGTQERFDVVIACEHPGTGWAGEEGAGSGEGSGTSKSRR